MLEGDISNIFFSKRINCNEFHTKQTLNHSFFNGSYKEKLVCYLFFIEHPQWLIKNEHSDKFFAVLSAQVCEQAFDF